MLNGELDEARLDVGLLDRTPLPLVMSALVIEKGRENHCVQLPREEVRLACSVSYNPLTVKLSLCGPYLFNLKFEVDSVLRDSGGSLS